jgi:hypothetical protein
LRREADHLLAHVDLGTHGIDERHEQVQAWAQRLLVAAQPLDQVHALLRHDPEGFHNDDDGGQDKNSNNDTDDGIHMREPPFSKFDGAV